MTTRQDACCWDLHSSLTANHRPEQHLSPQQLLAVLLSWIHLYVPARILRRRPMLAITESRTSLGSPIWCSVWTACYTVNERYKPGTTAAELTTGINIRNVSHRILIWMLYLPCQSFWMKWNLYSNLNWAILRGLYSPLINNNKY